VSPGGASGALVDGRHAGRRVVSSVVARLETERAPDDVEPVGRQDVQRVAGGDEQVGGDLRAVGG